MCGVTGSQINQQVKNAVKADARTLDFSRNPLDTLKRRTAVSTEFFSGKTATLENQKEADRKLEERNAKLKAVTPIQSLDQQLVKRQKIRQTSLLTDDNSTLLT